MSSLSSHIKATIDGDAVLGKLSEDANVGTHLSAILDRVANASSPSTEADAAVAEIGVEIVKEVAYDGRAQETLGIAPQAFDAFRAAVRNAVRTYLPEAASGVAEASASEPIALPA